MPEDCDPAVMLDFAQRHRVHALVIRRLAQGPKLLPAQIQSLLPELMRRHVLTFFAQVSETARLCALLEVMDARPIVLKGCALAAQLYADGPELRTSIDIDILVAPECFADAERVLAQAGYQRTTPEPDMPQSAASMARLLLNAYEYWNSDLGLKVELHHRLLLDPHTLPQSHDTLYTASEIVTVAGAPLRVLGKTDLALYLVCHGAGHLYARMKWLIDVARLFDTMSEDEIGALQEQAQERRCRTRLEFSLALIESLSRRRYRVLDEVKRRRGQRLLGKGHRAMLADERTATGYRLRDIPVDLDQTFSLFRLAESHRSRAFSGLQLLCNHKDLSVLGLSASWAPLYAVLGRPLALGRWLSRWLGAAQGGAQS